MAVKKEIILKENNIFVVKLSLETNDVIPEHHSKAHVTVTVIKGKGIFKIEDKEYDLEPGVFLSMLHKENHSIKALTQLELVVHHIAQPIMMNEIKEDPEKLCGSK